MMNKQHIAARLSEMLGRRVDVGLYSHIEDIFAFEAFQAQPEVTEQIDDEQARFADGTLAVDDQGAPIMGKKRTLVHVIMPMVRKKKIDERRIDHGEQYAYTDEGGKQLFVAQHLIDQAVAYLEANPPADDPIFITYAALRERMTTEERRRIIEARRTNWQIDDFVTWAAGAGQIDLNSDGVKQARAALIGLAIFSEERAAEVFRP